MHSTENMSWTFRKRDYVLEKDEIAVTRTTTLEHPLRGTVMTDVVTSNVRTGGQSAKTLVTDPLSMLASSSSEGSDPLSIIAREVTPSFGRKIKDTFVKKFGDTDGYIDDSFEPWQSKRAGILTVYTTSEKLSITTSFLSDGEVEKFVVKQSTTTTDKVRTRLEQLDDVEEGSLREMLNLSQAEYVVRIEELNKALLDAWRNDQRVKSLKIAIQCAKMLGETDVILFYPSKFVIITDILDNFGRLVYERIREKSVTYTAGSNNPRPLSENFLPEEVPDSAKETCCNWFYKVASIRELIPRLYVEMAILRCYSFLTAGEYTQALARLTQQIRGLADPLVSVYAKTYLCRVGVLVAPTVRDHLNTCWTDFLTTYQQLKEKIVQDKLTSKSIDMPTYTQLFSPALDWILQCVAYKAPDAVLSDILIKCQKCKSPLILHSVMTAFHPKYIASRALDFITFIREAEDSGFPKVMLYKILGVNVVSEEPPEESKMSILNEVWKVVVKIKDPSVYISCAEVWVDYPLKYLSMREVNTLLGNILKHMMVDHTFENHYPQLLSILDKIVSRTEDFKVLFAMENFLPYLDMFQKESVKVDACRSIMRAYTRTSEPQSDPVIVNALMSICKTMHDSVSAISLDDDRRVTCSLISKFIRTVSFGRDFERQLNFYVEARAAFSNLDDVLVILVQGVNLLTMETQHVVKGNHTRKTAPFIRACMAYCFITIPSLTDIFTRLKLYLLTGQIALANQAVGQADDLFRAAVMLLEGVPKQIVADQKSSSSEQHMVEYINNLMATLLVVPDHPDRGVMYLLRALLNVLQEYQWNEKSDGKIRTYMNAICLLSAYSQDDYLYKVGKVSSNDRLYGSSRKFVEEIYKTTEVLVKEVQQQLMETEKESLKSHSILCADLLNRIISFADLSSPPTLKLAQHMWHVTSKNPQTDKKFTKRLWVTITHRAKKSAGFKEFLRAVSS